MPARQAYSGSDSGSVTAEFAVLMPAVILILACCLTAVQLIGHQVRLTDAVADGSRSLARGDSLEHATDLVQALVGTVQVSTERRGEFVCMTLRDPSVFGPALALGVTVEATGCALEGGL